MSSALAAWCQMLCDAYVRPHATFPQILNEARLAKIYKVRSHFRCSALRHLSCGSWQDWFFPRRRPGTFWKSYYFKVPCTVCRIIHCFEKYWLVLVAKNCVWSFRKTRSFKMLESKVLDVEKQRSYRCAFEYSGWSFCLLSTNKNMFAWDKALRGDAQSSAEWVSSDIGDVITALT